MTTPPQLTTAFISYAREDAAFAHILDTVLTTRGIRVLIDSNDIAPAEVFEKRLDTMILEADAVVFLMSPDALASHYCQWEVSRAEELQKRIVPVVWRTFDDTGYRPPEGLRKRNWIFFDAFQRLGPGAPTDSPAFTVPFEKVVAAITTDIEWQREHTRHTARAEQWHAANRPENDFLLSGVEINTAQIWANRKPANESIPDLFFAHLAASLAKAERDLEELNARERRISARTQQLVAMEAQRALDAGFHSRAIRLCLAGEPSDAELERGVKPERALRAVLAAAAQASPSVLAMPHFKGVAQAQFWLNGTQAITASYDNIVRTRNLAAGSVVAEMAHDGLVTGIVTDVRGLIATASRDRTARLWRPGGGVDPVELHHADEVTSIALSPNGAVVATGGFDGFAILWDVARGHELRRFSHGGDLHSVAFSPDGQSLLTAGSDRAARIWDLHTGAERHRLSHNGRVYRASFSPDGRHVVTASEDSTAAIWDVTTGDRLFVLTHQYPVNHAIFSPNGKKIATASMDRSARLWDVATGNELFDLVHGGEVTHVTFSSDGSLLATASDDHTAWTWDTTTGRDVMRYRHGDTVTQVAFSPDDKHLLTACRDGSARLWRAVPARETVATKASPAEAQIIEHETSPDGTYVADGSVDEENGIVHVRHKQGGPDLYQIKHDCQRIWSVAFSHDSSFIATGGEGKTARVWNAANGREVARIAHEGPIKQVLFSPNGRALLTVTKVWEFGGEDVARLYDVATGTRLMRLPRGDVRSVAFGADGLSIITYCEDNIARTWDAAAVLRPFDEQMVRDVARDKLRGEGRLTAGELLILRPILGDKIEPDVVARWQRPSTLS